MIYRDSAGSGREHSIPANTAARGEYTGEMSLANPIINAAITAAKAPDRTPQRTEDTAPRRSVITASARKISRDPTGHRQSQIHAVRLVGEQVRAAVGIQCSHDVVLRIMEAELPGACSDKKAILQRRERIQPYVAASGERAVILRQLRECALLQRLDIAVKPDVAEFVFHYRETQYVGVSKVKRQDISAALRVDSGDVGGILRGG